MNQTLVPLDQDGVGLPVAGETLRDNSILVCVIGT